MRHKSEDELVKERLGQAVRRLRAERGLTRRDLERATELSYPYLSEIEGGKKSPSSKTLRLIADALGVEVHQLMELAERGHERSAPPPRSYFHDASGVQYDRSPPGPLRSEAVAAAPPPAMASPPDPLTRLMALARDLDPEEIGLLIELAMRLRR